MIINIIYLLHIYTRIFIYIYVYIHICFLQCFCFQAVSNYIFQNLLIYTENETESNKHIRNNNTKHTKNTKIHFQNHILKFSLFRFQFFDNFMGSRRANATRRNHFSTCFQFLHKDHKKSFKNMFFTYFSPGRELLH